MGFVNISLFLLHLTRRHDSFLVLLFASRLIELRASENPHPDPHPQTLSMRLVSIWLTVPALERGISNSEGQSLEPTMVPSWKSSVPYLSDLFKRNFCLSSIEALWTSQNHAAQIRTSHAQCPLHFSSFLSSNFIYLGASSLIPPSTGLLVPFMLSHGQRIQFLRRCLNLPSRMRDFHPLNF